MKSLKLYKSLLLLSVFYFPLVNKLIDTAFSPEENIKKNEYGYTKIWPDTAGSPILLKKLSDSWFETMRIIDVAISDYFQSSGFRKILFNTYRDLNIKIFGISPWPEKVLFGTQGWLFLGNSFGNVIKESKGIDTFDLRQLSMIRNNFRNFEKWRGKQSFSFYLAIAADKSSVYGEYLPIRKANRPTKADQVIKVLSEIGIKVIDLKKSLSSKNNIRLYDKTGTHWNGYGAFLGYQALMSAIKKDFPDIPVRSVNEYSIDSSTASQLGLSRMLSLEIKERRIMLNPRYPLKTTREHDQYKVPEYFIGSSDDYEIRLANTDKKYSILIFRDSFFINMMKYLVNDFKNEVFLWDKMNREIILKTKADIVVFEVVERELDFLTQISN